LVNYANEEPRVGEFHEQVEHTYRKIDDQACRIWTVKLANSHLNTRGLALAEMVTDDCDKPIRTW